MPRIPPGLFPDFTAHPATDAGLVRPRTGPRGQVGAQDPFRSIILSPRSVERPGCGLHGLPCISAQGVELRSHAFHSGGWGGQPVGPSAPPFPRTGTRTGELTGVTSRKFRAVVLALSFVWHHLELKTEASQG